MLRSRAEPPIPGEGNDHDYSDEVAFGSDDAPPIFHLGFLVRDPRDMVGGAAFFRPRDRVGRRYYGHRRDCLALLRRPHRGSRVRHATVAGRLAPAWRGHTVADVVAIDLC